MADATPRKRTADMIKWDTEERHELSSDAEGHIRDTTIYITAALWAAMNEAWGGVTTHIKTSTDKPSGEVTVAKADSQEPGAVKLRQVGSLNTAEFSFYRPLRKLDLQVPPSRQLNVTPFTEEVEGLGTVFVFPMAKRVSVPRNRKEEAAAAEPAADATGSAAVSQDPADDTDADEA